MSARPINSARADITKQYATESTIPPDFDLKCSTSEMIGMMIVRLMRIEPARNPTALTPIRMRGITLKLALVP